ncbi:MAG TPA: hypothetical protein VEL47_05680 [Myxococcota bacterium]|nr:hypothetical protein [Myxococcota bacterium]
MKASDFLTRDLTPMAITSLLLWTSTLSYAQNLVDDEPLTDRWSYDNTNAQTICGILGFLGLSVNFLSAWYFYRRGQHKLLAVHIQHRDELKERYTRATTLGQRNNDTFQQLVQRCSRNRDHIIIDMPPPSSSETSGREHND